MLQEYHKIETLFERDPQTHLLTTTFRNDTFQFLKDLDWIFTEKVDGTNIRVYWDGHRVSFYGRTDSAQIPQHLANMLMNKFGGETMEQMFEQRFGEKEVILYGEGYGPKIQKGGGLYSDNPNFILFDVYINDKYLDRDNVENVAAYFGIDVVPVLGIGNIDYGIQLALNEKSKVGKCEAPLEGVVGRPRFELYDSNHNRVIVKIKKRDFEK